MNSIYFKSIKHQSNTITFSREEDVFFATGEGVDTWTDKTITFQKARLDAFDIKLQFGRGDSDITLSLSLKNRTSDQTLSIVIGGASSGDIFNSADTYYKLSQAIQKQQKFHEILGLLI